MTIDREEAEIAVRFIEATHLMSFADCGDARLACVKVVHGWATETIAPMQAVERAHAIANSVARNIPEGPDAAHA